MKPTVTIRNVILFHFINNAVSFSFVKLSVDTVQLSPPSHTHQRCHSRRNKITSLFSENNNDNDEFSVGETYDGDVDWDSEWKKVVQNQDQPSERPGKDFYKNDVEKAIGKTAKAAQEQISKIPKVKVDMPSQPRVPMSLSGDAKLWLAIIAIVSIGSAVIGASGNINAEYTNNPGLFDI